MKMMKNENVKTVKGNEKVWKPNENQRAFLEALKGYETPVSLMEIAVDSGVRFASGVVTPLVKRGLVIATDVEVVCDIMFKGVKVGEKKNAVKAYALAKETK
jgi:hypothetical protein